MYINFHEITNITIKKAMSRPWWWQTRISPLFSFIFLKAAIPVVHTPYVFLDYLKEYYEEMITNYRKFCHLSYVANSDFPNNFAVFSSIFFGRSLFLYVFFLFPYGKNAIWTLRKVVWFCLFQDLVHGSLLGVNSIVILLKIQTS